ncbi:hypothetical protein PG994_006620 [Apiospora phragmitis]|uniref:Extended synaptotagmin-2 n=1 Tax=Apiospora phragmitis TaxID=2905665 RepID=A0ABR1VFJ1_9PEZI
MAGLMEKLDESGSPESTGFLNKLIENLWPNINVAGSRMVKDIVEPMFATMLPGPLAGLKFVKVDLGNVPLTISAVEVHKTEQGGIKLDMNVVWDGKSDVELDGHMIPKLGIERVQLKGRLSVLLAPLTNIIPLVGAAQVAFINPPSLKLDFTDAAEVADWVLIDKCIRKCIMNIIASMAVLPNRYLVKLDATSDYFQTYLPHVGALRLTVSKAVGLQQVDPEKKKEGIGARLLEKLSLKDTPDYYCRASLGAEEEWRSTTKKDEKADPEWDETHDFLVADLEQEIALDVRDEDPVDDDDVGVARTTVKQLLLAGGEQELPLMHKGEYTGAAVVVRGRFLDFVEDAALLESSGQPEGGQEEKDRIAGLATVLIGSVRGLQPPQGYQRDDGDANEDDDKKLLHSVKVEWSGREFVTAAQSCRSPDDDDNSFKNPNFDQAFRFPLSAAALAAEGGPGAFKMVLLNGKKEAGSVDEERFDLGAGVTVRARISLRALRPAQ